ncbi:hypothetical protein Hoch_2291 [Haliangium ochraceum DSM 14365]|uniref:Uncharacterized protein n=1 Tax=Haliangium ochraceum (strain DSM 14365 / JCM 11303 / SMP-2) TaxID=502025 RepID=D0LI05_HALO1|nr:hypothetical protein Hoch_2291 [Haliangium ochraceum DSM 14365]
MPARDECLSAFEFEQFDLKLVLRFIIRVVEDRNAAVIKPEHGGFVIAADERLRCPHALELASRRRIFGPRDDLAIGVLWFDI